MESAPPVEAPSSSEAATPATAPAGTPPEPEHGYVWQTPFPPDVPPELAARLESIAPPPPQWVNVMDAGQVARWELCSRIAAGVALDQGEGDDDKELRMFAWHTARVLFQDPSFTM